MVAAQKNRTPRHVRRWAGATLVVFIMIGFGFGTWLSRLPALRDALDATTQEMSYLVLTLALGTLAGLFLSGRLVIRFGPRRAIAIGFIVQAIALTSSIALIVGRSFIAGLAALVLFGVAFAVTEVSVNVTGAGAERAIGKARMPLFHSGFSLGTVGALGAGALAEVFAVPLQLHFIAVFVVILISVFIIIRGIPLEVAQPAAPKEDVVDEPEPLTGSIPIIDSSAGQQPAFSTLTGTIPIITPEHSESAAAAANDEKPPGSVWKDRRILLICVIAMSMTLVDGAPSDWLPIALVDGRGISNEAGTTVLSLFFVSVLVTRLLGSALIDRLGRVLVIRASAILCSAGIALVILLPTWAGIIGGTVAWGIGAALAWPIAVSAAADRPETSARDVAAVSMFGYAGMMIGPIVVGFIGEQIGLLQAFWVLIVFAMLSAVIAGAAREPWRT